MSSPSHDDNNDASIQATCSDAANCKASCMHQGYLEDPFISCFVRRIERKEPLIHRGYFARVSVLDELIQRFLTSQDNIPPSSPSHSHSPPSSPRSQLVILGAGHDTTVFRFMTKGLLKLNTTRVFEVDFPEICSAKLSAMSRHPILYTTLGLTKATFQQSVSADMTGLFHPTLCPYYALLSCDLREMDAVIETLLSAGMDQSCPTLFVSECVLIYLDPVYSEALISWASSAFEHVGFVLYEQILPNDNFGQMMLSNLEHRGCPLRSLTTFPSITSQIERFRQKGYNRVECIDMNEAYYHFIHPSDRTAIERLELFDEVEEFHLMQAHYCVVLATLQLDMMEALVHPMQHPRKVNRTSD